MATMMKLGMWVVVDTSTTCLLSPNAHIYDLICMSVIIKSLSLFDIPPKAAHAIYSMNIAST